MSDGNREGTGPAGRSTSLTIELCERRFADLRAAWRALTPPLAGGDVAAGKALERDLQIQLAALAAHVASDPAAASHTPGFLAADLLQLDVDLHRYGECLCLGLDALAPAQLLATMPSLDGPARAGLTVLFERCLTSQADGEARIRSAEYLATVLCTEERGGSHRVSRDPASLSPRIRSACERIEAESDVDSGDIEWDLIAAARSLEEAPCESLAQEMSDRKALLGRAIFAAPVLRAAVYFNAALPRAHALQQSRPVEAHAAADLEAPSDSGPEVGPTPTPSASNPVDVAAPPTEIADVQWTIDPQSPSPPAPRAPRPRARMLRIATIGAGLVAAAGLVASLWLTTPPGTVQNLSKRELASVSSHLGTGYRDAFGFGPLFVGTVTPDWRLLSAAERARSSREIIGQLGPQGVREILLYGDDNRIAVHFAEGRPVRIGP